MMNLKLSTLLLFLTIWAHPMIVQAQSGNPTPQPEQAFIQKWTQEIIFPSAIRFTLVLALPPSQINLATLVIKPETRPSITIPMDLDASVTVGGEITEIVYIWQIPSDNPPLLFRDVEFEWRVTANGTQNATIFDMFTFSDQRANWLRDLEISKQLKITLPNGLPSTTTDTPAYSRASIDEFTVNLKRVSDLLTANLGNLNAFDLLIYDKKLLPICSPNAKGELVTFGLSSNSEVSCDPASADRIFTDSSYVMLSVDSSSLGDIQTVVSDYVVRKSYEQAWGGKDIPQWFQTGLALLYSPALKAELGAPLFNAARTNSLLHLDVMAKLPTENVSNSFWQSESYGLVVFIASRIGIDGLFKLSTNVAQASSFASAYSEATGMPLETLVDNFRQWLFTDSAVGSFAFTPYQEATPSPTASRTPTATNTPTPTTTPTLTPTPTVTGVLSLTPLPSRTATLIPTIAPATNTPRPAGSLNTATPISALTVPTNNTTNNNLTIGLLIFLVGAIIVAVVALILLRPKR